MAQFRSPHRKTIIITIAIVLGLILAFFVGYLVRRAVYKPVCRPKSSATNNPPSEWAITTGIKAEEIDANLKYLSKKPHVAASARNNELASEIERRFKQYGLEVETPQYNVLLSYPQKSKPNYAYILDGSNTEQFKTQLIEVSKRPDENSPDAVQPFNAFSPAGIAIEDLVYANFGRDEDFQMLQKHFNVNCSGKIVITRYGKNFRGAKVFNAQKYGAIGIMIYNDPINYAPTSKKYPNGIWMPADGVQRGSISNCDGDCLTPGWPSSDGAYRLPVDKAPGMPKIPCHPISAKDAYHFMSKMDGPNVGFANWTGGLNVTYRVGPGFRSPYSAWKVKIEINNEEKQMRIKNVIGTLRGSIEPDRYVMIGNHRDSWVFGGVDASSGGSIMLEIARVFGEMAKKGFRPARSIKFCSWDGEESGLIGSIEYVEQNVNLLMQRAIAYINTDTAVFGNYSFHLSGSPLLYQTIYRSLKQISDPNVPTMSMFEKTVKASPSKADPKKPFIGRIGSGSDYYAFYQTAGIPAIDIMYGMKDVHSKFGTTSYYPVYHSLYDTYYWMKTFIDPKFLVHRAVARFAASLLLKLSTPNVIPLDPRDYSTALSKGAEDIKRIFKMKNVMSHNVSTAYLDKAIATFTQAANTFHSNLMKVDTSNPMNLRMVNDQLSLLEKGFVIPAGLPNRPTVRHVVFSSPSRASYGSSAFPGVTDLLYEVETKTKDWGALKKHLTVVAAMIEGVATTLNKI